MNHSFEAMRFTIEQLCRGGNFACRACSRGVDEIQVIACGAGSIDVIARCHGRVEKRTIVIAARDAGELLAPLFEAWFPTSWASHGNVSAAARRERRMAR